MNTYYTVMVRDDHDGGSIWIVHEDFIESFKEANGTAYELSLKRPNRVAKVIKVTAKDVVCYYNGNGRNEAFVR